MKQNRALEKKEVFNECTFCCCTVNKGLQRAAASAVIKPKLEATFPDWLIQYGNSVNKKAALVADNVISRCLRTNRKNKGTTVHVDSGYFILMRVYELYLMCSLLKILWGSGQ